ncbi:putative kinase [Streptacidiphilus sp. MAP12-16]|uniref:AAA family ATPase n=1 Tax=Streptacidiphilus sp. MAP12-16 TaxID=3156300 RepID=UPI0035112A56
MVTRPEPRLILLCGLPGAGKTTLAKRMAEEIPAVRLCPDEWMARLGIDLLNAAARDQLEGQLWEHAQELFRLGQTVILEFGFWDRAERDEKRLAARALRVPVELHYLAVPLDELFRRVTARYRECPSGTVPISRNMLEEHAKHFETPGPEERDLFDEPLS